MAKMNMKSGKMKTSVPSDKMKYVCADAGIKGGRSMATSGLHNAKSMPQNSELQKAGYSRLNGEMKGAGKV